MPRQTKLQEVIIVSASKFANREYVEKNNTIDNTNQPKQNNLKDACWNGLLKDIMPELFLHFPKEEKLFLWQMRECRNVFTLELSEKPGDLDMLTSIDPYCFLELQEYN